jgi:hypothetical protein
MTWQICANHIHHIASKRTDNLIAITASSIVYIATSIRAAHPTHRRGDLGLMHPLNTGGMRHLGSFRLPS